MVDALRSAWDILRPRGHLVDLRPANGYTPTIVIRRGRSRLRIGPIVREPDPDVAAASRAVGSVLRAGRFTIVHRERPRWVASYAGLAEVERTIVESEHWHLPAATRRRITRELRRGDAIEIARRLSLAVLRRRG
jgi:hypothetical protein